MNCQRDAFSLPDEIHYLNCAYMSPTSRQAEAAGRMGLSRKADPSRIPARLFFEETDRARELFARLINVSDPTRIAIIPSASYGIAVAARNLGATRGQKVVIAHEQFPSNVYAWRELSARDGLELSVVQPPEEASRRGEVWNTRLLEAIDRRTAVVAVGNVHWADGTRFDVAAIGQRARDVGAAFVVDGTQSIGALPFDVALVQPDAVICAGYKWLLGPYSIGVAYYGPRFDDGSPIEDNWIARLGSEDFRALVNYRDEYQPGALRYDVGERSNFILMPMLIAGLEQVLGWGPAAIQEYCRTLTGPLLAEMADRGFAVEGERWRGAHLFGLRAPKGLDLSELAQQLDRQQVFVSLRGNAIRVSPHVYNDSRDIEALADVLRNVMTKQA